ncbi:MAG: Fic family protein [Rhodothalassiaceae bacterium]
MNPEEFANSPSGRLVRTVLDQWAFVPNPLPPALDTNRFINDVDRASRAMAELKGMRYKASNPLHLINPLQHREAISSSNIEATYTTPSELLLFEPDKKRGHDNPDTREVYNYIAALEHGLRRLDTLPVSSRLIRELHGVLLKGVRRHRGAAIIPGAYKRDQNFIGTPSHGIAGARFIPAPPADTDGLMSDLEKFIHSTEARQMPPVVLNALVHYQFETIHPFPDGNGRLGRLLVPLLLVAHDILPVPLLYISPAIERHKDQYNDLMLDVSRKGAWEDWICFFARMVEESAKDAMERVNKIAALRERYLQQVRQARASALLPELIDLVFDKLSISIPDAADHLGVTYRAAKGNVEKLIHIGQLVPLPANVRPKRFVCQELLRIIFDDDSHLA